MIAASGAIDNDAQLIELLDHAVLSSDGVYAELRDRQHTVVSSLVPAEARDTYREDFRFGEHADSV
jgi:hypothetical protein